MSSIRDVAKHAGVGVATVSRALNGSGYVAPETMQRIMDSVRELNYVPNELARNLFHQQTRIVALLVPTIQHPFFSSLAHHIESELTQRGYKLMLCNTSDNAQLEQECVQMLERNMVDGIISASPNEDTYPYILTNRPLVAFDRSLGENIPIVRCDHAEGGRLAAQAIIDHGCKCVLHCGSVSGTPIEDTLPCKEKDFVFEQTIKAAGIRHISMPHIRPETIDERILSEQLRLHPEIDGFFAPDNNALCFLHLALKNRLRVPEDVAIVSYDGTILTELGPKKITCIVQPLDLIAQKAVELLMQRIEGGVSVCHTHTLPVLLRQGETTSSAALPMRG